MNRCSSRKTIWSLWLQGWDMAPEVVRACARSWSRLNPSWAIHRLTRDHVRELLPPASPFERTLQLSLPPEALSDIVRLELLARFGGVWVDATTYCLVPLDRWLGSAMTQGFFAFDRPGPDRMLSTWFIAAEPSSPVILRWRALAELYWSQRSRRGNYFWLHYLFEDGYRADPEVRRIWDATPKYPAGSPLMFVPYQQTLYSPLSCAARKIVEGAATPLLKLTHKLDWVGNDHGTLYRFLCDRELKVDASNVV
jgi:hypothetical protein